MNSFDIKNLIIEAFTNCEVTIGDVIDDNWIQTNIRNKLVYAEPKDITKAIQDLVNEGRLVRAEKGSGFSLILK